MWVEKIGNDMENTSARELDKQNNPHMPAHDQVIDFKRLSRSGANSVFR